MTNFDENTELDSLRLWEVLKRRSTDEQRAMVRILVRYAIPILDRVVETFPAYTIHNSAHARNVAELMADVLGPRINDLSGLEAALLILSAYFHDIGMVFSEAERSCLDEQPEWADFINTHPEAFILYQELKGINRELAEWYCRWRHAERVSIHLDKQSESVLRWDVTPLRRALAALCRSHNQDAKDIVNSRLLHNNFLADADLKFCAIVLRVADILDFDRVRSPESVYEYLGLKSRNSPRIAASDVEWRKHLCSDGFRFPKRRERGYAIDFIAAPNEPTVEYDVRQFLDTIESELLNCAALVFHCSERWRDFEFPIAIDRSNIHSNGYCYGEYRFTLDQTQILDLLMGENLYNNPYSFVRELVQNAIDSVRHREYIECSRGRKSSPSEPIRVTQWRDSEGCQWVRLEDSGMGMDEPIIREYLLKVGASYYNSSRFKAEVLRARRRGSPEFVPISRFGIGLLSCFLIGNRVEISTLRFREDGVKASPIRLSIDGVHGFYTLQTENSQPSPMPVDPTMKDLGCLRSPGTAIAVRVDPSKEREQLDMKSLLRNFVLSSQVPIEFEGEAIGVPEKLLEQPWCDRQEICLNAEDSERLGILRDLKGIKITLLPIDLTRHASTPELRGQILLLSVTEQRSAGANDSSTGYVVTRDGRLFYVIFSQGLPRLEIDITQILPRGTRERALLDNLILGKQHWLSRNGISVPVPDDRGEPSKRVFLNSKVIPEGMATWGIIALSDSLRPDMLISREGLKKLPWRVYSHVNLALCRGLHELQIKSNKCDSFNLFAHPVSEEVGNYEPFRLEEILQDPLFEAAGPWAEQAIIPTTKGRKSLLEIKDSLRNVEEVILGDIADPHSMGAWEYGSTAVCAAVLLQIGLCAAVRIQEDGQEQCLVVRGDPLPISEGEKMFPPLAFLPFLNSSALRSLRSRSVRINKEHWFSRWLIAHSSMLRSKCPGILRTILSRLFDFEVYHYDPDVLIAPINEALTHLCSLHPHLGPAKDLLLSTDDFTDSDRAPDTRCKR